MPAHSLLLMSYGKEQQEQKLELIYKVDRACDL